MGSGSALQETLAGSPYADRLVSSEKIVNAVRGRKSSVEVARIRGAVEATEEIFNSVTASLRPEMTEVEIAALDARRRSRSRELGYAWGRDHCPAVNAGPEKAVGHSAPGELRTRRGELLHVDFGVQRDDYCSDLQRVWYFLEEGETAPPPDVAWSVERCCGRP